MHAILQKTHYGPQIAIDVTSIVRDYVLCAKNPIHLRKQASFLELLLMFEQLQSFTVGFVRPLHKSRRIFQLS